MKDKYSFADLVEITAKLRSPEGCPWDREQTFESLKKYLAEESQEVFDAVDHQDMENLCEELGDVLFQVMINSQIAQEKGAFTIDDVVDGVCRKMVRVVNNTERVLAIELLNAAQALEFRRPLRSSWTIEKIFAHYRKEVPFVNDDTCMYPLIEKTVRFLREYNMVPFTV